MIKLQILWTPSQILLTGEHFENFILRCYVTKISCYGSIMKQLRSILTTF